MAATGINWGSLLPLIGAAGAGLFGASTQNGLNGAAQNAARGSQQLYNFGAGSPTGIGGSYTANPGGLGGNTSLNFGNLTGVNGQLQNDASQSAIYAGANLVPGALTSGANNAFGVASGNINPANANANNFYGAASTQLQAAGQDPTAYANGVYSNLTAQAKPWEDAQTAALQDSQFGKGQAGTSGGALQTQAFAQGLGTADLQRQITAQQMGQQQQAQAVSNAGQLSGAGSSLLQNAFSNFNTTQSQQQQLAALPAYLQSLNLQNSGSALTQQAGIQGQAQSLLGQGLTANTANGNLMLGAASALQNNANSPNATPYSSLLQSLFGSAANSATNSTGSSLLQQLFGGSSAAGGEAAPAAAGTAGQAFAPSGALTTATPGGTTTLFGNAADVGGAGSAAGAGDAAGLTTTFGDTAGAGASATGGGAGASSAFGAAAGATGAASGAAPAGLAASGSFATGGGAGAASAGGAGGAGSAGLAATAAPIAIAAAAFAASQALGAAWTAKNTQGNTAMKSWMQATGAKWVPNPNLSYNTGSTFQTTNAQNAAASNPGTMYGPDGKAMSPAAASAAIYNWATQHGVNPGDFHG